jgi:hypothetical protein
MLVSAAKGGHVGMVRMLVAADADVNYKQVRHLPWGE